MAVNSHPFCYREGSFDLPEELFYISSLDELFYNSPIWFGSHLVVIFLNVSADWDLHFCCRADPSYLLKHDVHQLLSLLHTLLLGHIPSYLLQDVEKEIGVVGQVFPEPTNVDPSSLQFPSDLSKVLQSQADGPLLR